MTRNPVARPLAVIAGSGMGELGRLVEDGSVVPFADIDGVGSCTVEGHAGDVREGTAGGRPLVVVLGRRHLYEGEPLAMERLVCWLAGRGVTDLVVASAAGGLRGTLRPGEIVVARDVVRASARSAPPDAAHSAPTVPLMLDRGLTADLEQAATRAGVAWSRGTLVCVCGPGYETPAEVRALQEAGGDVVTMSAAPEVAAANRHGIRAAVVAIVTNPGTGIASAAPRHRDVLEVGATATRGLARLIRELVAIL